MSLIRLILTFVGLACTFHFGHALSDRDVLNELSKYLDEKVPDAHDLEANYAAAREFLSIKEGGSKLMLPFYRSPILTFLKLAEINDDNTCSKESLDKLVRLRALGGFRVFDPYQAPDYKHTHVDRVLINVWNRHTELCAHKYMDSFKARAAEVQSDKEQLEEAEKAATILFDLPQDGKQLTSRIASLISGQIYGDIHETISRLKRLLANEPGASELLDGKKKLKNEQDLEHVISELGALIGSKVQKPCARFADAYEEILKPAQQDLRATNYETRPDSLSFYRALATYALCRDLKDLSEVGNLITSIVGNLYPSQMLSLEENRSNESFVNFLNTFGMRAKSGRAN